jgi:lysophospholipase L1-like esterase
MGSDYRICFFGDSFTQGTADEHCLGWVGRLCAAARAAGHDVTAYNLGVRRDTSADIRRRWRAEYAARLRSDCDHRIVFCLGANDMTVENGRLRVETADSVANFRALLAEGGALAPVLALGPLPVNEAAQDRRILDLCARYARIAAVAGVPYLPLARGLLAESAWKNAVAGGDGTHPDGRGYALIAETIRRWPAWWFSAPVSPE